MLPASRRAGFLTRTFLAAVLAHALVLAGPAWADSSPPNNSGSSQNPSPGPEKPGFLENIASRTNLLGDLFGLRTAIAPYGLTLSVIETSEVLGNPTGGVRQGALYEGLTDTSLTFDMRPYFHWRGVFYARAFQIHGSGLSGNNLDNLDTVSSIEADRATRLSELWYEQRIGDWLRIRVGQQAADQEFLNTATPRLFVNSTFGWPTLPGVDLPSGGPAYPLATPAVRFRVDANDELTFYAALYNGNPTGAPLSDSDPQARELSGTAFRINDGALALFQVRYNPDASDQKGTYELGAWYNSEKFPDQHLDTGGVSLASPLSNSMPRLLGNDYSVYAVIDQPLFRSGDETTNKGFVAFARAMGAPGDRNLVDFYFDAGLVYRGPFGRDNDSVGIGYGYAQIGSAARLLDSDTAAFTGTAYPTRSRETVLELTYASPVLRWLIVQPDFQYITNPGGGIPNPNAPGKKIGDEAVFGLRTVITF